MVKLHRNKTLLNTINKVLWHVVKKKSNVHDDISDKALDIIIQNNAKNSSDANYVSPNSTIMYVSTHKSLWETIGIPYVIHKYTNDVPFVFAGNNLHEHWFLKKLFDGTGVIDVIRVNSKDEKIRKSQEIQSTKKLLRDTSDLFSNYQDSFVCAEGTRSKDGLVGTFYSTIFQAAIAASKNNKIPNDVYIVPVNVDYTNVLDLDDMLSRVGPYKFKLGHLTKWFKTHIGDVYVSMGDPVLVTPEHNRDTLSKTVRENCMDLVKILPINIFAEATYRTKIEPGCGIKKDLICANMEKIIQELNYQSNKFRGFDANTNFNELLEKYSSEFKMQRFFTLEQSKKISVYANYIRHYTSGNYDSPSSLNLKKA